MADAQESRMDEMERSLGALQTEMREQIARTRVNTRVVLIVGLVIVIILIGYLSYLFGELKKNAGPEPMAQALVGYVTKHVPEYAPQVEESLKKMAPQYVKMAENMALERLPELRTQAIAQAKTYLESNAPKLRAMAIEQGKTYLKEHAEEIRVQLAKAAHEYLSKAVAQIPLLREKAIEAMHKAIDQIPEARQKAEEAALTAMSRVGDELDQRADAIVDELLAKKAMELAPLIQAAGSPDGDKALTEEFTKNLDDIVGAKMDDVLKEFDATLTPYEQTLDRLLQPNDKLTPEERLHKEMITSVLLILDDALALGQLETAPAPAPVVTP